MIEVDNMQLIMEVDKIQLILVTTCNYKSSYIFRMNHNS